MSPARGVIGALVRRAAAPTAKHLRGLIEDLVAGTGLLLGTLGQLGGERPERVQFRSDAHGIAAGAEQRLAGVVPVL